MKGCNINLYFWFIRKSSNIIIKIFKFNNRNDAIIKLIKYLILIICFINIGSNVFAKNLDSDSIFSGGSTTRKIETSDAFSKPAKNLPIKYKKLFSTGNKLFNTEWNNDAKSEFNGLGPTFNGKSCIICHVKDGRSIPPKIGEKGTKGLVIFINNFHKKNNEYGRIIDTKSIFDNSFEAIVNIKYKIYKGIFPDGSLYNLSKPVVKIEKANFGPIPQELHGRISPAIIGLGLLENIPDKTIIKFSDPEDKNNDGISGRPNIVNDPITKKRSIGRFGWKAGKASIHHQVVTALYDDIGITSEFLKLNRCPENQKNCLNEVKKNIIEAKKSEIDALTFYSSVIAVPARRYVTKKNIQIGKELFIKIGCAKCHIPEIKTGSKYGKKLYFLNNQNIQPYTDLLLQDMGEELAEATSEGIANQSEWRTAPLWGLGLIEKVNGSLRLLHDGRAKNIEEAIIWHGGEGYISKKNYMNINKKKRILIIKFLESL